MKKEYTQQEMEQILKGNAEIPLSVNRRIEDTYRKLGLTGNTRKRKSGFSGAADRGPGAGRTSAVRSASVTVHKKKRRAWTAVAAAAALAAGLSLTAFAVVNFMNVRLNDNNGTLSYDFQIDPSVSEAHEISVTPTYLPEGYTDTDDDRKWQDADNPDNSIILISYNAAEIYLSEQTGEQLFRSFGEEEYVKTVEIQGMQTDLFLSGSTYTDSTETQKDLFLCSREQGYVVQLISIAEDQLSDDEMIKIAEGLDIRVLDETVPFPTEEEIAQAKAEFEFANSDAAYPDIKASDIYAAGDTLRDQNAFSDGTDDSQSGNIEYRVTDIQILDSLPLTEYPKENYISDYDTIVAPLLNDDGTLKPHDRHPGDRVFSTENLETTGSKFVAVTTEITNISSTKTEAVLSPSMVQLKTNGDGTMSETIPYYSASKAYQEIARDGFPLYQSIQTHTEDNKKHVLFTDIEGGETLTCTSVYVVDDDCIDSSCLSFFRDIEALSKDGEPISQPYVKIR